MTRSPWEFEYEPFSTFGRDEPGSTDDLVVATSEPTSVDALRDAAGIAFASSEIVLDDAPLHWVRVRLREPLEPMQLERLLRGGGTPVRYVTPAARASSRLGGVLDWSSPRRADSKAWRARDPLEGEDENASPTRWFLDGARGGVDVRRRITGFGAGTRLAVIDDDAREASQLDLDDEVPIGVERVPRNQMHGPLMIAWAVGARGRAFRGVAPSASPRLYVIPKAGVDVLSFPLAIARAVLHGADVVLCATYLEGVVSPMLDDALELATRVGRAGKGTAIVLPTGRETASPRDSAHGSFSIGFGDVAADPRVFCIAPGGNGGGWFLWPDRKGRLRPFANRSPAVRWTAPGDDMAYPFSASERLWHAESSGAAAVAAGVMLLVLGACPELDLSNLERALTLSSPRVPRAEPSLAMERLADRFDVMPHEHDPDGHNAKVGYGALSASLACAAASDPFAAALVGIGAASSALAWILHPARDTYSRELGRSAAIAYLENAQLAHGLKALARHARLVAQSETRARAHGSAVMLRNLVVLARAVAASLAERRAHLDEIANLLADATEALGDAHTRCHVEAHLLAVVRSIFHEHEPRV